MNTCDWQTGYGLPWDEYCGKQVLPGAEWCQEHLAALSEEAGE